MKLDTPTPGKRSKGVELIHPTHISYWLIYNPTMAILDDDTNYVPSPGGHLNSDYMAVGPALNGKTQISFVKFIRMTGEHVDEASIISEATIDIRSLKALHKLLGDRIKELD